MSSQKSDVVNDIEKLKDVPKDKYSLVYCLFFLLSFVNVIQLSSFLTANSYWMYKFRNTSISEANILINKTSLQVQFAPAVTIALEVSPVIAYFLGLSFRHKFNLKLLVLGTLWVSLASFIITASFVFVDSDDWQGLFFAITIILVSVISGMNAMFGLTMMELAACFPTPYFGFFLIGVGMGGISITLLQLISLALGVSTQASALVYFWSATTILAITIALLTATLKWNVFFNYYIKTHDVKKRALFKWTRITYLIKKIWPGGAMMVMYSLTVLGIHPALTALIVPENAGRSVWSDKYFIATITFFMPTLLDYCGRLTALKFVRPKAKYILIFCLCRFFVFVPLLLLCNVQPKHHLPVVFYHDYQYIIIMAFYGLTNGYCSHMIYYIIPTLVPIEDLEDALKLNVVIVSLITGSLSFMSFVSVNIL